MAFQRYVKLSVDTKGGDSIELDKLRIDFDIERSNAPEGNRAIISVYNLKKETSAAITEADGHIMLEAGYEDESKGTVFTGDILRGTREWIGNDYITTIEVYDGRKSVMGSYVSLSYAKGTSVLTVAQALLGAIGMPYKGTDKISGTYDHGYCYIGIATEGLLELLARCGLSYTVQDETIFIMEVGKEVESTGLELKEDGDLISLPQPVSDKTDVDDIKKDAPNRWVFSTKLNPQIMPGASLNVESSTFKGDLVVCYMRSTGSNMEGDFHVMIEAEAA